MRELSIDAVVLRRYLGQQVLLAAAIGLTLGLFGPFGTYEQLGFAPRVGYWIVLILCGLLFFPAAYWAARLWLGRRGWPVWLWLPVSVAAAAVPMTLLAVGLTHAMLGETWGSLVGLYPYVLSVGLPVTVLRHSLIHANEGAPILDSISLDGTSPSHGVAPATAVQPAATLPDGVPAALLSRLSSQLGHDILCLEMEDHYVRVHTRTGSDLVLMRMRDAVAELHAVDGLQVHRSWWVARSAVAAVRRQGKSATLILANGIEAPVARDRMPALRASGWLDLAQAGQAASDRQDRLARDAAQ